jgi:hypothetical protein
MSANSGRRVIAVGTLAGLNLVQDDRPIFASILDYVAQRILDRARENADANRLILVGAFN